MISKTICSLLALLPFAVEAAPPETPPAPTDHSLDTVIVQGQKLSVETRIDRKIYSVPVDAQSTLGTLSDMLSVIPSVDVDPDGIVSLRGDTNVLILIDGKPATQLQGSKAGENLQSISAPDIERIEVLTTPPAQFKAEGAAVDTAADRDSNYYYVSVGPAKRVAVLDAATLTEIKSIPLEGESDAILYEPGNGQVYVTHDDGANVWVIDPQQARVTGSIAVPGVPEVMVYDETADRIYLNIKSANEVAVINPATNATVASWETAPAGSPHGMALDSARHRIFTAGANGKLAVIDTRSGKVIDSVDIAPRVDQIAFDAVTQRVYCAGIAKMTILDTSGPKLVVAGELATAESAKNVAIDPLTHAVWTTYTDGKSSFAKSWRPQ